jgi:hypothetical protein
VHRRGAAFRAAPEESRRRGRQHFGGLLFGQLDQVGDRGAERRGELAERGDRWIGFAVLDLDEETLADAGQERGGASRGRRGAGVPI